MAYAGGWRTIEGGRGGKEKRVGGDEEAVDEERKILSCSHARREGENPSGLPFAPPSLAFFLGEIDQRPRETD